MLFYFSATGNSRYAAERLGEMLSQSVISIPDALKSDVIEISDDTVGIILPVYFAGLPTLAYEFVSKLKLTDAKKVFTVMTYGGFIANASNILKKLLSKNGIRVTHSFEVRMPDNYVPMYRVPSKNIQEQLLKEADKMILRIPELLEKESHLKEWGFASSALSLISYPIYKYGRNTNFWVMKRCTSCGLCEKVCPIDVISLNDGIPQWNAKKCVRCLACVHRCPAEAIQLGNSKKHGRYLNPNVKFDENVELDDE
ncbi:MAG: EFR1 family ferrodoxin [Methanomassiliicoccaceae archaeon]|nr:EFR1 family ferrodoxin [Methanomassiliicoccaceae archaeon]